MVRSHIFICLASFLLAILELDAISYYVSPDGIANETCTSNESASLRPCYTLQQLSIEKTFLSDRSFIRMLLLPGKHVTNHTLAASNVMKLEILPWYPEERVTIQCSYN
jgi:hypothetical protein